MRLYLGLALLGVLTPSLLVAQKSPKESARPWMGISEQIYSGSQFLVQVASSVASENTQGPGVMGAYWQADSSIGTAAQTSTQFQVYPGRLYTFTTASGAWTLADIHFVPPPGYTVYLGQAGWSMTPRNSCLTTNFNGGSGAWSIAFYIVPNDGSSWMLPGYSQAPRISDITWGVSLGTLSCGASAGTLRWRATSLTTALLDSSALNYACPSSNVSAVAASYITGGPVSGSTATWYTPVSIPDTTALYYDANGNVKFIATNQVELYIARNSGTSTGYSIQVYPAGTQFEWANNDPTQMWTFNGSPNDQYVISDPDSPGDGSTWAGRIQIVRTTLDAPFSPQVDTWILGLGTGGKTTLTQTNSDRILTVVSQTSGSTRSETCTTTDSTGKVALMEIKNYQGFVWGEELVSDVIDPSSMDTSGSALNLTTTYTYYSTTWGDGQNGKLQSVTRPDGSWVMYSYYNDFARLGNLATVSTPWQDAPATVGAVTTSPSNCRVVTYSYSSQIYTSYQSATPVTCAFETVSAGTQTAISGTAVGQSSISSFFWDDGNYNTYPYGSQPMRTDVTSSYSTSGVAQTTTSSIFDNCADPIYNGKPYYQINPDGTKASYSYWKGTLTNWLGSGNAYLLTTINPSSSSVQWVTNVLSGTSTQQDPTAVQFTSDGVSGGLPIDPVWMTPYKSYRKRTIYDSFGHASVELDEVFTGGTSFVIIGWKSTGYTWDGLLFSTQDSTGAMSGATYIEGHPNSITNSDRTTTGYLFDSLMRVTTSQRIGVAASGSMPAQQEIETAYTYDALNHVLTTSTAPYGGGLTLTTASSYNYAGMITSKTDTSGLVTTYAYTNGARTLTTTFPNGSTSIVDRHLDGSPKSTTGNAQVDSFTTSAVNTDGTITTTVCLGTSGSARFSTAQADWLGRTIAQTTPAFVSGTFIKTNHFNTSGQLYETTQTGQAPTWYQYDGLGQLQYKWLNLENDTQPDLNGSDRVTEVRSQVYMDANYVFWNQTLNYVFGPGSSTAILASETRQRLLPYPSQGSYSSGLKMTETDTYDYYRNLTTDIVSSGYQTAITTETVTHPDSSVPAVTTSYNGLLESSQSAQNITTTYQYDVLGRQTGITDPRTGTAKTAYYTTGIGNIGQVQTQTDAASNSTTYAYDTTDGRLSFVTDPLGDTIYHAYDHAGREIKTWGSGTFPVAYAFDVYGAKIAMRTFRVTTPSFTGATWPLSDDGVDPQNPNPSSWRAGDVTTWTYDGPSGLLASKTDASKGTVAYTYNLNGTLSTRTWARGVKTTYGYDANTAEKTSITYSDGTPSIAHTFDRLGHLTSATQTYSTFTLSNGLSYDVRGKIIQEAFDSTFFGGRQVNYELDTTHTGTLGRTIGFELGNAQNEGAEEGVTFGFDTYGRFDSEGMGNGPTFTYNYETNSNLLASITDSPDFWAQTRGWEPNRNLLTSVATTFAANTAGSFAYTYDQIGRRATKVSTGTLFARYPANGITDGFEYDSRSEVTSDIQYQSTNAAAPTTPIIGRSFAYGFDPIGNRVTSSVDTQQSSYTANALNQYSQRTVPGYYAASGFAPIGGTVTLNGSSVPAAQFQGQYYFDYVSAANSSAPQWLSASLSSSLGGAVASNAFIPKTPEPYVYDADGNIQSDGRWNYLWDAENRLITMETYGHQSGNSTVIWNSGVPRIHLDFEYDYKGRRISKKISNWSGSAFVLASESRFAYENWNVIADYSVSGITLTPTHWYMWGMDISGKRHGAGGVGGLLAMITASGFYELPIYDANGNVQGLTDRISGQITASYEYSSFGETLRAAGIYALSNPFRFSSRYTDDETHLLNYGHRYYNTALGRFLGRDPVGEKGGLHLYGFTGNNSVNRWDYLGLDPFGGGPNQNYGIPSGPPGGTVYPPGSLAALLYGNSPLAGTQAYLDHIAEEQARFGSMGNGGGGGANLLSGVSEIPGASDMIQMTDTGFNPIADNLGIATVFQMNSSGKWGYGTSNGTNFTPNIGFKAATTPLLGSFGTIQNLGTVGNGPIGTTPQPTAPAPLTDLTAANFAASTYINHYTANQLSFADVQTAMDTSGTGTTLQFGAAVGETVPYIAAGLAAAPTLAGLYVAGTDFLAAESTVGNATTGAVNTWWGGTEGLAAANASGGTILTVSSEAEAAAAAGDYGLVVQESQAAAQAASGAQQAFLGSNGGSIFLGTELPALVNNPAVTTIEITF